MPEVSAKQPFVLPAFYVPWPARLNPSREAARLHVREWARAMGIVRDQPDGSGGEGGPSWDAATFDAMDFALMAAYTHPDAPEPKLELLTDWYAWSFYYDDYFHAVYKRTADRKGGQECIDRLLTFMPLAPSGAAPAPTHPLERGLADLWARTVPGKSAAWRLRYFRSTRQFIDGVYQELSNISEQRVANPIEYIELRRRSGGSDPWVTCLIEYAGNLEVPERIVATRPMRVLRAAFADAIHLRNDLFSYQRELQQEGELTNCVLVLERFLNTDTQRAAELTNDLLTSRLQQFENTAVVELPGLFEEYGLDPAERAQVSAHVRGMQDWQSGCHEWHLRSGRYMKPAETQTGWTLPGGRTELGASAAQLPLSPQALGLQRLKSFSYVPRTPVAPVKLPRFYMPWSSQVSPHLEAARRHAKRWARRMGMMDGVPRLPGFRIWDERKFDQTDAALGAALLDPQADAPALELTADWLVWGTYSDDYFQTLFGQTRDLLGAKGFAVRLSAFMPDEISAAGIAENAVERGLSDLWSRTTHNLPGDARSLLRRLIVDLLESWLWRLLNQLQNRIPDPVDYLEMRRKTFGAKLALGLFWLRHGRELPPELPLGRAMSELEHSAADYVCLTNDIVSYQKELEFEGELNNYVLVVQRFLDLEPQRAVAVINDLMTARLRQFERVVAIELPLLCEELRAEPADRERLQEYVRRLQQWMCGALKWHLSVGRYKERELCEAWNRLRLSGRPMGLGTAAAGIAARLGGRLGLR